MPESKEHSELVAVLRNYIAKNYCDGEKIRVLTDSMDIKSFTRPPSIAGYIPDAYVSLNMRGGIVIGEAKSMGDLENSHTEAQVAAFLRRCKLVEGSVFILAVPWPIERLARSFVTELQKRESLFDVEAIILSEIEV